MCANIINMQLFIIIMDEFATFWNSVVPMLRNSHGVISRGSVPNTLRVYYYGVLAFILTANHQQNHGYITLKILINGVEKASFPIMDPQDAANLLNTLIASQLNEFRRQRSVLQQGSEAHWVAMDKLINAIVSKKNDFFI
jgi:hypothetical protein